MSETRTIWLQPLPHDIVKADDRTICGAMFGYWSILNASRYQVEWPMPAQTKERHRLATIGLESHVNDAKHLPIAKALSLTAQLRYRDGAILWRQIIDEGSVLERLNTIARKWHEREAALERGRLRAGNTNTRDGTRRPRGSMRALIELGKVVFSNMKKGKEPLTRELFIKRFDEALEKNHQKAVDGSLAGWPFKDKSGRPVKCPRSTKSNYLTTPHYLPPALRDK